MQQNELIRQAANRVIELVLDDPEVQRFLDSETERLLGRKMHMDRDDESWWACRKTVAALLLIHAAS